RFQPCGDGRNRTSDIGCRISARITDRLSRLEPDAAGARDPPRESADLDPAAGENLRARDGERPRASRVGAGTGDLRGQSPEPLRRPGDPRFTAAALALPHGAGDDEG